MIFNVQGGMHAPAPVRSLPVRETIADYQVEEPWPAATGRYSCRPPGRLGRTGPVMVTELTVDAEGWPGLADLLIRLAGLGGLGVLDVIEVGPDLQTGGVFLVTEPAPGGTLSHPARPLDRRSRCDAVEAAARAAHALHEAGLAHGCIHAGAVVLSERGAVLDLPRLDRPPGEVVRVGAWRELVAAGPELLAGEAPSRSSDVWALGALLHDVLTDRPLFPGVEADEPVTAVQRVMFTRPEPDPAVPSPLLDVIAACLRRDPAERPATALDVAGRIAAAAGGKVAG